MTRASGREEGGKRKGREEGGREREGGRGKEKGEGGRGYSTEINIIYDLDIDV